MLLVGGPGLIGQVIYVETITAQWAQPYRLYWGAFKTYLPEGEEMF